MTTQRKGELYAAALSLLEGLFPILSLVAVREIGALNTYFFVLLIATAVLLVMLKYKEGLSALFDRDALPDLLWTSFYITTLFVLLFISLRYTTAGNLAVILTLQLFFSYLYFNRTDSERMNARQSVAALLMGAGAVTILLPTHVHVNPGDLLVLLAAAIAPIANYYQKCARSHVSALTILTFRNLVALPVLLGLLLLFEDVPSREALLTALPYIAAVALLVYVAAKLLWIESLHRIGITKLSAMIALIPIFTLLFAYLFLHEVPTIRQIIGAAPILIGGYLITKAHK